MIKVGEKITVIDFYGIERKPYYTIAVVTRVLTDAFDWQDPNRDWVNGRARFDYEGATWTRGWHDITTGALDPLRVAKALT